MRTGGAMLLVAVGLIALWVVVTGRLDQLKSAWMVLGGTAMAMPAASTVSPTSTTTTSGATNNVQTGQIASAAGSLLSNLLA